MADETIIERLSEVRGIGRWSAEMLLMFRLGRPDVLPVDDYGVRKGFAIAYDRELPSPKELAAYRRALEALPDGGELVLMAGGGAGCGAQGDAAEPRRGRSHESRRRVRV